MEQQKSSDPDEIPNVAFKHIPTKITYFYTILFNNLLNNMHFPHRRKKAKVVPILKKGKEPSSPSSYRPISLLSNMGKVYEMLISYIHTQFAI